MQAKRPDWADSTRHPDVDVRRQLMIPTRIHRAALSEPATRAVARAWLVKLSIVARGHDWPPVGFIKKPENFGDACCRTSQVD
jgi:hypothetical protein